MNMENSPTDLLKRRAYHGRCGRRGDLYPLARLRSALDPGLDPAHRERDFFRR
jgi:hypothetical protein